MKKNNMLILFGGTFNPPTKAHLKIVLEVQKQFPNAEIVILPVNDFYQKENKSPSFHRLNMCKLLFDNRLHISVSDHEIKNTKNSYTLETLEYFRLMNPTKNIFWLMGSDNLVDIINWYKPNDILKNYSLLVTHRTTESDIDEIINQNDLLNKHNKSINRINIELNDFEKRCSSTLVRNNINNFDDYEILKYINKDILSYIKKYHLYSK